MLGEVRLVTMQPVLDGKTRLFPECGGQLQFFLCNIAELFYDRWMEFTMISQHSVKRTSHQRFIFFFAHSNNAYLILIGHALWFPRTCAVTLERIADNRCEADVCAKDVRIDLSYGPFTLSWCFLSIFG